MKIVLEHHQTPHKLVIKTISLRSSILKRSKQTLVPTAIVNSFSPSQRIALIHYFPLEVNGGRFLSLLVPFGNTATRTHNKIKQNRSRTKQEFSREAFSKQIIEASLTPLSCSLSQATTEWSAVFAFGVCHEVFEIKGSYHASLLSLLS